MRLSLLFLAFLLFSPVAALRAEEKPNRYQPTAWEMLSAARLEELKKQAEDGDADAQYELAHYYLVGPSETPDDSLAMEWCRKAAGQGHKAAKMLLYYEEYDTALENAEKGDALAQYIVGSRLLFDSGDMTNMNAEGLAWLEKAEKQGLPEAVAFLAQIRYYRALSELKAGNISEGISRMEKTAEAGNPFSQVFMGVAYADGVYVKQDAVKMLEYLRKAAEQEYLPESMDQRAEPIIMAQILMASCYLFGTEVPRDVEQAVAWMTKAHESKSRLVAYCVLGDFYANDGRDAEAVEIWEQGLALAETEEADEYAALARQEMMERLGKLKGVQEAQKTPALLENVPAPEEYGQLLYVPFYIRRMLSPDIAP